MSGGRRDDLLAAAILILLPTLLFSDVLTGRANFAMRDLTRYYYPTKQIYGRIVAEGELPLWNRYFQAGQPLAANPEHEIFYPPTWLLFLPDFYLGYRLHILIHIYIGLLAMYALLRSMRLDPVAAVFGAIGWGLGGLFLSYINLLPIFFSVTWLPFTCLFGFRFMESRRTRDFALASISFGMQCLVGEPTTLLQTGLILGGFAIYLGMCSEPRLRRVAANVGWVGLMSLTAIAVGAVQMLPAIDHATASTRARGFGFELVELWSMPWGKLPEMVFPNFLGHVPGGGELSYWGGNLYGSMGAPFVFSIYPGLAMVALFVAALVSRTRGHALAAALVVTGFVLALGSNTPLLRFLYDAGVARSVRYPEKFVLIAIFAVVVLGARACDELLTGKHRLRQVAAGFALATSMVAAGMWIVGSVPAAVAEWMIFFRLAPDAEGLRLAAIAADGWAVAAARGFALFLLLVSFTKLRRKLWLASAFLFVVADLGMVVRELNPTLPRHFFMTTPPVVANFSPERDRYRLFHLADWQAGDSIGLEHPHGNARYWTVRNGLFPMMPAAFGIETVLERDYDMTSLLPTDDFTRSMWAVRASGRTDWLPPFLAMSGVRYVAVARNDRQTGASNEEVIDPIRIVQTKAYPRYYFADQIVPISDRQDFVRKLSENRYTERVAFIKGEAFPPARGRIIGVSETANTAVIDAEADGLSLLVMSVTAHKYWHVTIDGSEVEPVVVNVAYQGVAFPKGRHRVVMVYRNPLVTAGGVTTLLATACFVFIAVRRRKRV